MSRPARGLSSFAIAATYVGTVVGAGFATGQEVLRFFTHFGLNGVWAVIGATFFFAVLGGMIIHIGHELRADSHVAIVNEVAGPAMGRVLDWVITFFLFGSAAVMMAGSGAVFAESFGLNRFLGTLVMAVISGGTVLMGLRGVVKSISAVAPVLIMLVAIVSLGSLVSTGISDADLRWYHPAEAATAWWPVSLFLYVSYNLVLSIAVLGPLGKEAADERTGFWGGVTGGVVLGLGALLINLALLGGLPESANYEVPMIQLARRFPAFVSGIYAVVLWLEVYTTAVSSLYGLTVRLTQPESPRYSLVVGGASVGALVLSQVGFSQMVNVLFPVVGWLGLILVGGLILRLVMPARTRV
ncbi:MAG: putative rane protein [Symbiobacteriaceae bacterium]|jgi:uncharacterized membrane protein YkvI|nr:putative rane protein [Symbiobacteriaceae bacterium]